MSGRPFEGAADAAVGRHSDVDTPTRRVVAAWALRSASPPTAMSSRETSPEPMVIQKHRALAVLAAVALVLSSDERASAQETRADPAGGEVALPAHGLWKASLVYESDVGIWTVGTFKCFPGFGCPEVYGLDDKGRFTILASYAGRWTPYQTVEDREWLGAVSFLDLDPRRTGDEIYTAGKKGNLYQIQAHREGGFDCNLIARFPGQEIHTLIGGDLLPSRPGRELLAFAALGDVYEILPGKEPGAGFETSRLERVPGRVRDALVLPAAEGRAPWIAGACRSGEVLLLRMTGQALEQHVALKEPMGLGRIARRRTPPGAPNVLYVSRDDGVILRLEERGPDDYAREVIYAGPQGPRGIAAGRFDADAATETVAVFGYSGRVEVLARRGGAKWSVEVVFEDEDKGHWLAAAELDGRNGTDELVGSGYAGRIFLLSRPPGYGLEHVATSPVPESAGSRPESRRQAR
jgi:hypothetical protein